MVESFAVQKSIQAGSNSSCDFCKNGIDNLHERTCGDGEPGDAIFWLDQLLMVFYARIDRVEREETAQTISYRWLASAALRDF